jgi:hypothetical protein
MKPHNAKNSHKQARNQRRTGMYKKYIKTLHNIIYTQLSSSYQHIGIHYRHTEDRGTKEHECLE